MTEAVLYFGECTVDYDGRASSYLPSGDRLVLIRPNTVTVHSLDDKVNPVNYMQDADIDITDGTILASRENPSERLEISFSCIDKKVTYNGSDEAELLMSETEEELQLKLYDNSRLIDDDFVCEEREYDTGAGRVDIMGFLDDEKCLVEVKKTASIQAISQLSRYLKADDSSIGIIASNEITSNGKELLKEYDDIMWKKV